MSTATPHTRVLRGGHGDVAGLDWSDPGLRDAEIRRAEEIRRAFEQGRAEGRAEAEAQGAGALPRVVGALNEAAAQVQDALRRRTRAEVAAALDAALDLAAWILRREATLDPGVVLGRVEGALAEMNPTDRLVVRVAPGAARAITEWAGTVDAEVREDPTLQPGEALIDAGHAGGDLTYSEAFRRAREALEALDELDEPAPDLASGSGRDGLGEGPSDG